MNGARGQKRRAPAAHGFREPGPDMSVKKRKPSSSGSSSNMEHALLSRIYPNLQTLRAYIISQLPSSSRLRRKKIASIGASGHHEATGKGPIEAQLAHLLDTTIICWSDDIRQTTKDRDGYRERWSRLSQKADDSRVTLSNGATDCFYSQSEVVDFVVWLLFSRKELARKHGSHGKELTHILCDGFRTTTARGHGEVIPGIFSLYPNRHVEILKEQPWPELLMLLGRSGERIMIDLLADCAIFTAVEVGRGNLFQLSGIPVSGLSPQLSRNPLEGPTKLLPNDDPRECNRKLHNIKLIKSRMFYAKPALSNSGRVHFGLRHIHILSRCSQVPVAAAHGDHLQDQSLRRLSMYMFPRQFGLHNAFTSVVDWTKTSQALQDYTVREEEIRSKYQDSSGQVKLPSQPKRLRGDVLALIHRLRILHGRCSYGRLLVHHCPTLLDAPRKTPSRRMPSSLVVPASTGSTANMSGTQVSATKQSAPKRRLLSKQRRKKSTLPTAVAPLVQFTSTTDLATPVHQVSAFCQAVLSSLIPKGFWGKGPGGEKNEQAVLSKVDHFIRLRRFEAMSLAEISHGLRITDMQWLVPPALRGLKASKTDMDKRHEILNEFLYYVFDSLLIPLIRSNFYVTESSTHRYKLFFFRHDVWRHVAEPSLATLKCNMFEEVKTADALAILNGRPLKFSQLRLLPKGQSMRPIMNLRRRTASLHDRKRLDRSINSVLGPVYSALRHEMQEHPGKLGAALFSVGDLYDRMTAFRAVLGPEHGRLFFAKVDVQAAFDTIPQEAVLDLMSSIMRQQKYKVMWHTEVTAMASRLMQRRKPMATSATDVTRFTDVVGERFARGKRNTVFVDGALQRILDVKSLMALMKAHVRQNMVKMGKKYFRQKQGIPQGSVLSSTICNYFYADLERRHLGFLSDDGCLLLRLIDDFLLITTDVGKAEQFVRTMHRGLPEYGVIVNPAKTLVNFDVKVDGIEVARAPDATGFPYCGMRIDCASLALRKDRTLAKDAVTENGLTVEFGHTPGLTFQRKVFNAFKIQSHAMFYDTSHNSTVTVLANLLEAFRETAAKMVAYRRCLPIKAQPTPKMVADTIARLAEVAYGLLTSQARREKHPRYAFAVSKAQVKWLALQGMKHELRKRQSQYREVLVWVDRETSRLGERRGIRDVKAMHRVVGMSSRS